MEADPPKSVAADAQQRGSKSKPENTAHLDHLFCGQCRAMKPTTIQPMTRAAMLRPRIQPRTAARGRAPSPSPPLRTRAPLPFYMVHRDRPETLLKLEH